MSNRSLLTILALSLVATCVVDLLTGCDPLSYNAPKPMPVGKADQPAQPDLALPAVPPEMAAPRPDMAEAPPDMTCGGMQFQLARVPPNVVLVLDRSGSMGNSIDGTSTTSKWTDLKTALGALITNYDSEVRFGVDLFSGDGDCGAGPMALMPADNNGAGVLGKVTASSPAGNTPTAATLAAVLASGAVSDPTRQSVVVLATDGEPNCADTDVAGKITALYAANVKTYVIGVGTGTASNPDLLNSWAVAGHTDRTGATKYYQTNSSADLKAAFDAVAGGIVSCVFTLSAAVPDPTQIYVWSNGQPVASDAMNGFSYDGTAATITLNGSSCDALKANPKNTIQVTYGCPAPPPIS